MRLKEKVALITGASGGLGKHFCKAFLKEGAQVCVTDIAQDMVDYLAFAQSDPYTVEYRGGWRYYGNIGESDNSVSQWPVIGMEAAEVNQTPKEQPGRREQE